MTNATDRKACPYGTPWCTHHENRTNDEGHDIDSCVAWPFVHRPPIAPDANPAAAMYLSASRCELGTLRPGIGFSVFGSIPWGVQPEAARKLAAALLEAADIVDTARSARCPTCGELTFPDELEHDGRCYACQFKARQELLAMMRGQS